MNPIHPNQHQVGKIFEKATGLADQAERRAYLEMACAGDDLLRQEVESLVDAHERAGTFLKTPVMPPLPLAIPRLPGTGDHHFGDFELLEEIARGGMGVVYKARQVSLNRVVAVKMILSGQFASEAEVKRFHSEAQAAASLNHPNIVGIYEVGEHQGQHYYCMPFLEGQNLAQLVESGQWRPGDGTEAARLVAKVAGAVQCAHDAGIVHRDLKPGNILLGPDGEPRVTDFGLARRVEGKDHLTLTGTLMGTPSFMAPEQARGRSGHCSSATDIYSLGAVLYYLLTGRPPFVADSALDPLFLVLEGKAVLPRHINPLISGPLEHICLRCLEKRPEDRYASAGELGRELERYLKGESLAVNPQAMGRRFEAWAKRQPALVARFCTVLLCLGIILTAYQLQLHPNQTLSQHREVIAVLVSWLVISLLCQRGVESARHATWVRFFWSGADLAALTVILLIAQAHHSPLVLLYATLIAASGFWFRVSLVAATTAMSLLGYTVLLWHATRSSANSMPPLPPQWHLLTFVAIVVTGVTVAYLVNRVSVLTRFYEHRPPSEH